MFKNNEEIIKEKSNEVRKSACNSHCQSVFKLSVYGRRIGLTKQKQQLRFYFNCSHLSILPSMNEESSEENSDGNEMILDDTQQEERPIILKKPIEKIKIDQSDPNKNQIKKQEAKLNIEESTEAKKKIVRKNNKGKGNKQQLASSKNEINYNDSLSSSIAIEEDKDLKKTTPENNDISVENKKNYSKKTVMNRKKLKGQDKEKNEGKNYKKSNSQVQEQNKLNSPISDIKKEDLNSHESQINEEDEHEESNLQLDDQNNPENPVTRTTKEDQENIQIEVHSPSHVEKSTTNKKSKFQKEIDNSSKEDPIEVSNDIPFLKDQIKDLQKENIRLQSLLNGRDRSSSSLSNEVKQPSKKKQLKVPKEKGSQKLLACSESPTFKKNNDDDESINTDLLSQSAADSDRESPNKSMLKPKRKQSMLIIKRIMEKKIHKYKVPLKTPVLYKFITCIYNELVRVYRNSIQSLEATFQLKKPFVIFLNNHIAFICLSKDAK